MKERYRAAIIGLGFIGGADQVSGDALGQRVENLDGTHIHAYQNNPRIDMVAGSSRDMGRRQRFVERMQNTEGRDVPVFADWKEMIATTDIDVVSIATYTPVHAEITVACAGKGIPVVYCEKPIARTLSEADTMISVCGRTGSLLVVNHQRRFNGNFRKLAELAQNGELGTINSVTLRWPNDTNGSSSMDTAVSEIVHWLDGTASFPYPPQTARTSHEIIVAFHVSDQRNGAWVDFPLSGNDLELPVDAG